jgi:hypothetical protein
MRRSQIDALFFPENLRPSDYQIFDSPPGIGNIIGQVSGTVRHIPGLFKNRYLQVRHGALCPAGSAHAGRIAADDHKVVHETSLAVVYRLTHKRLSNIDQ